jgi:hypothetical protein
MAPTPLRIAQTSTELKKQRNKNGPQLTERQQKQLERDHELDKRAARAREAEERRKAAKKKREQKEAKEAEARKQMGIGLATQMIGYRHTQAQLKNGMEAFLGVQKRKDEEKRKKQMELTKRLEEVAEEMEKEPWDEEEDMVIHLPDQSNTSSGEQWADDDLDDDSLLEAHDMLFSDPIEEPLAKAPVSAPVSAPAPPTVPTPLAAPTPPKPAPAKEDPAFARTHGPINKAVEAALDKLPEPLIELLSQDLSMKVPDWNPPAGLLHKLNPLGLPPHRLRIKVGCVVSLLRDLNTSSQLSKSQHLRVLRCDNHRLECLVLDGQLEGTKTFLTRVPFCAKYRNLDQHPFQRTQFPIRVATDYTPSNQSRDTSQSGFKLPAIPGRVTPADLSRKPIPPVAKPKPQANQNPSFKLPGVPASRSFSASSKPIATSTNTLPITQCLTDGWDDFLESGTQIARELDSEPTPASTEQPKAPIVPPPSIAESLPPMSTQDLDFDFSLEDLEDEPKPKTSAPTITQPTPVAIQAIPTPMPAQPALIIQVLTTFAPSANIPKATNTRANSSKPLSSFKPRKIAGKTKNPGPFANGIDFDLSLLRPSQLPYSDTPIFGHKRKTPASRTANAATPPVKKHCAPASRSAFPVDVATTGSKASFEEFVMSTQDAASFFDDDDSWSFGSPPIAA